MLLGYASAKSHLYPLKSQAMASRFKLDFDRVIDLKYSSEIHTIQITPFSLRRDVCIRSNMPWKP